MHIAASKAVVHNTVPFTFRIMKLLTVLLGMCSHHYVVDQRVMFRVGSKNPMSDVIDFLLFTKSCACRSAAPFLLSCGAVANLALIFLLGWRPRKDSQGGAGGPIKY
jgi:hypothetical protein